VLWEPRRGLGIFTVAQKGFLVVIMTSRGLKHVSTFGRSPRKWWTTMHTKRQHRIVIKSPELDYLSSNQP
jgi:hypothetical protein